MYPVLHGEQVQQMEAERVSPDSPGYSPESQPMVRTSHQADRGQEVRWLQEGWPEDLPEWTHGIFEDMFPLLVPNP